MQPQDNTPPDAIPAGYCQCGCGTRTPPASKTERREGRVKGEPLRYVPYHHLRHYQRPGDEHPCWNGGRHTDSQGYVNRYAPQHPHADTTRGYVYEHRLVWEDANGYFAEPGEEIHHRDGNKLNNDPANLALMPSKAAHRRHHVAAERQGLWGPGHACCTDCGTVERPHHAKGLCRRCYWRRGRSARPSS